MVIIYRSLSIPGATKTNALVVVAEQCFGIWGRMQKGAISNFSQGRNIGTHDRHLGWGTPYNGHLPWGCAPGSVTLAWRAQLSAMLDLADRGIDALVAEQNRVLETLE